MTSSCDEQDKISEHDACLRFHILHHHSLLPNDCPSFSTPSKQAHGKSRGLLQRARRIDSNNKPKIMTWTEASLSGLEENGEITSINDSQIGSHLIVQNGSREVLFSVLSMSLEEREERERERRDTKAR